MHNRRHPLRTLLLALACAAGTAAAHDTWFEPLPAGDGATRQLALGTGNRFPLHEIPIAAEYLVRQGCRHGDGAVRPMQPLRLAPEALVLALPAPAGDDGTAAHASCWAMSTPFEVELGDDLVALYFREIRPSAELQQAWAAQRARGQRWKERYVKHARIELGQAAAPTSPSGMPVDLLLARRGELVTLQLLADGSPRPGQAVELVHERSRFGIWRETDAEGRITLPLPITGRWLARATLLQRPEQSSAAWQSRFVTLAFEVGAR